jgi:S-adenosyl-L-methionine hydrolase (adenosine-forming)
VTGGPPPVPVGPSAPPVAAPTVPVVPAVYFTSDYGHGDEFVGVVHAVLHRFAPGVPVIDLSHEVPAFDIAGGADLLVRCAPVLGPGVVLAVVDPGVGSNRRAVALRVADASDASDEGSGPAWLVGPDNGLLVPLATVRGGVGEAREIDRGAAARRGWPAVTGARTFDGRDLFAPAAAHLVRGGPSEALGPLVDPASLSPPPLPAHSDAPSGGRDVAAAVNWVDRFGNVQLDLGPDDLERVGIGAGAGVEIEIGGGRGREAGSVHHARRVAAFDALGPEEVGVLTDGNGRVALVCDRASAAERLGHPAVGVAVRIRPSSA